MPVLTAYLSGFTMHTPAAPSDHERAKRGRVDGWSADAVRRHTAWLRSIDTERLSGFGYALTLTMGECPPSAAEMHAVRRAYLLRLERLGVIRTHWVCEWQRRGVPHFHLAVYFPGRLAPRDEARLLTAWLEVAAPFLAGARGQDCKPISGPDGWLQYLSKHAARGVQHYQRQGKPQGWTSTGRLWGHTGDWPEVDPFRLVLDAEGWYRLRRLARAWRIADARSERDPKARARRIASARRCLSSANPRLSAVRGVSEWCPQAVQLRLVGMLQDQGHWVQQLA